MTHTALFKPRLAAAIHTLKSLSFIISIVLCYGCSKQSELADFTSDGCTFFPDNSLISNEDWCVCCFEHDLAYWMGGTKAERLEADKALRDCVLNKTGNEELAELMYQGVRVGGSPYFYNGYRWGYGWGYERKYQALSNEEQEQVNTKLTEYYASNPESPCEKLPTEQ